jgi:hypothetical protein
MNGTVADRRFLISLPAHCRHQQQGDGMMSRLTVPTQIDLIDYMLSHHGEVPILDQSLSSRSITAQLLQAEGIEAPAALSMDDENEIEGELVMDAAHFRLPH